MLLRCMPDIFTGHYYYYYYYFVFSIIYHHVMDTQNLTQARHSRSPVAGWYQEKRGTISRPSLLLCSCGGLYGCNYGVC